MSFYNYNGPLSDYHYEQSSSEPESEPGSPSSNSSDPNTLMDTDTEPELELHAEGSIEEFCSQLDKKAKRIIINLDNSDTSSSEFSYDTESSCMDHQMYPEDEVFEHREPEPPVTSPATPTVTFEQNFSGLFFSAFHLNPSSSGVTFGQNYYSTSSLQWMDADDELSE